MSKRYNIGYIGGHKTTGYPSGIQKGIKNAIQEQGHNLIVINDLLPQNEFIEDAHFYLRVCAELASRLDLDAYLVSSGVFNAYASKVSNYQASELIRVLDPAKTVVFEDRFDGYRYVRKENRTGMQDLMRHLIHDHGYKKICFISGPETSAGARERESVYFEEMEKAGLPVNEHMFFRGFFSGACDEVVEELLYYNTDVEAIACASDHIALCAYRVLKSHGLTPGEDVAVTGFDDISEAAHASPPLTTVHLTGFDIAYKAAYEAVRLCEGKPQKTDHVDSRFVHRFSCGEKMETGENAYVSILQKKHPDLDELTAKLLDEILESKSEKIRNELYPSMRRLASKVESSLNDNAEEGTEHLINVKDLIDIFRYDLAPYLSYGKLDEEISKCIDALIPMIPERRRVWLAEERTHFQRLIANRMVESVERKNWVRMEHQYTISQILSNALMFSDNRQKALEKMFESVQALGIKDAYLFEFPEPVEYFSNKSIAMGDLLYLRASLKDGKISTSTNNMRYPLYRLISRFIPEDWGVETNLMTTSSYSISGLLSGTEMLGVMIIGPCMLGVEEIVRLFYQMAFGLKHLQMIRREKELITVLNRNNLRLSRESERDELTGLYNRRGFMNYLERIVKGTKQSVVGKYRIGAIFYMDLDGLKQINDTYGHDEGDFAITKTARILEDAFGESTNAIVGRQGGDEYLGFRILREEDGTDGDWMITRIEEIMERVNKVIDKPYRLEISVGYKAFELTPEAWEDIPAHMDEADTMLYENKRAHKAAKKNEIFETAAPSKKRTPLDLARQNNSNKG